MSYGDEPFRYYNDGLLVCGIVLTIALFIISPFFPFVFMMSRKLRSAARSVAMCLLFTFGIAINAIPLVIILSIRGSDAE